MTRFPFPYAALASGILLLAACASTPPPKPEPKPLPPPRDMIAAIHAAGSRVQSAVSVVPLRDPEVQHLVDAAHAATAAGQYAQAAQSLDKALAKAPEAPDILQDRAELAVRLHHYAKAEQLAHSSWSQGPRVGSLCARNWQTVSEMRLAAGDQAGAAKAREQVASCRVKDVIRM